METNKYLSYWSQVEPLMKVKLEELKQRLSGQTQYTLSDIYQGGDEEFRLTLDLRQGDKCILGADFTLLDGNLSDGEDGELGIMLGLTGYSGLALGGYYPGMYTPEAFTADLGEILDRVERLDVVALASYILNGALTNPVLLAEFAKAA